MKRSEVSKKFKWPYIYWPGKNVPPQICSIKIKSAQSKLNPYFAHKGFGVVFDIGDKGVVHFSVFGFIKLKDFENVELRAFEGRPWRIYVIFEEKGCIIYPLLAVLIWINLFYF